MGIELKHDIYVPEEGTFKDIQFNRGMIRDTECSVSLFPLPTDRMKCYADDNGVHTRKENMLAYDFFFALLHEGGKFFEHAAKTDVQNGFAVRLASWHPHGPMWIKVKSPQLFQAIETFIKDYISKADAPDTSESDDSSYPEDDASSSETSVSDSASSEDAPESDSSTSPSDESTSDDDADPVTRKTKKVKYERKD